MTDKLYKKIIDFFVPPKCEVCEEIGHALICDKCKHNFISIPKPVCCKCGIPLDSNAYNTDGSCADCRKTDWFFTSAIAAGVFTGELRTAILNLKYNSMVRTLSEPLTEFLLKNITLPEDIDYLCPVPIHKKMMTIRGYNQSLLIAEQISKSKSIPVIADLINKDIDTPLQHLLSREERQANINRAFKANTTLSNENIAIIDDVFTTGMTVNACARALKKVHSGKVYIITIARAVPKELLVFYKMRHQTNDLKHNLNTTECGTS